MKVKRRNNKSDLREFQRYIRGEMTKREEHAFQRKIQKDPFADEALEGFEEIDPRLAEKDVQSLRKQLKNRILLKPGVLWYRIAASVAVLMILSSVIIIVVKNKSTEQIAYSPPPAPSQETREASEKKEAPKIAEIEQPAPASPEISKQISDSVTVPQIGITEKEELKEDTASYGIQDAVAAMIDEPVMEVAEERAMAARTVMARETKYTESEEDDSLAGYTPPLPVNGRSGFENYIENNIRRPDSTTAGVSLTVVLNFLVTTDGIIDSIIVKRSQGKIFSDEAIRLIKEGPAWKPAVRNGKTVSDTVSVRIVFN